MIHDLLDRTKLRGRLLRIERAQRFHDARSQHLRRKLRAHHQFRSCRDGLGYGHINFRTGGVLEATLTHIGNHADHAALMVAYSQRQASNRILAGPLAACGGLVDDDDRFVLGRILPIEVAAGAQVHAHRLEVTRSYEVGEDAVLLVLGKNRPLR